MYSSIIGERLIAQRPRASPIPRICVAPNSRILDAVLYDVDHVVIKEVPVAALVSPKEGVFRAVLIGWLNRNVVWAGVVGRVVYVVLLGGQKHLRGWILWRPEWPGRWIGDIDNQRNRCVPGAQVRGTGD